MQLLPLAELLISAQLSAISQNLCIIWPTCFKAQSDFMQYPALIPSTL